MRIVDLAGAPRVDTLVSAGILSLLLMATVMIRKE